jgi:hypothetical protein
MHFKEWLSASALLRLTLGLSATTVACGLQQRAIESTRTSLSARYADEFACAEPEATESSDGFRVEGCGQVAFYHCNWSYRPYSPATVPSNPACPANRAGCPSSFSARVSRESEPDCLLEHVRPMTTTEQLAYSQRRQGKASSVAVAQRVAEEQRQVAADHEAEFTAARSALSARTSEAQPLSQVEADDGHIELERVPADAAHVLFRFTTPRELSSAPCRPTLVRDDQILHAETIAQHSEHEASFLVRAADIQGLDQSQRFRGVICGVDFTLDESARRTLATGVARR